MALPTDAHQLSETSVVDSWVNSTRHWMVSGLLVTALMIPIWLYSAISDDSTIGLLLSAIAAILAIGYAVWYINNERAILDIIAVQEGHPWHDSDAQTATAVFVLDRDKEWITLPVGVRIHLSREPLLGGLLLRDGDDEGEVIVRWGGEMKDASAEKLVNLINMAQALREAQERDIDEDDPFEAAREREISDDDGDLLQREWLDTTPGQIEVPLGAIIRKVTGSTESEDGTLRTIGKSEETDGQD
jgi:hypothetical protein